MNLDDLTYLKKRLLQYDYDECRAALNLVDDMIKTFGQTLEPDDAIIKMSDRIYTFIALVLEHEDLPESDKLSLRAMQAEMAGYFLMIAHLEEEMELFDNVARPSNPHQVH